MKTRLLSLLVIAVFTFSLNAQDADSTASRKEEKIKDGFSLGGVPVVAYDSDIGFKYGALLNLYWYDSLRYPKYDHSIYMEWSRTTKGNGINQITYDSDKLIPGIRSFLEFSYLTEKALDFYGFNGYQAIYDSDFERPPGDGIDSPNRLYYKHSRKLLRVKADFQGEIIGQKFRWLGGVAYYGNTIDAVDVDDLNEGNDEDLLGPNSLYKDFVDWGVLDPGEDAANPYSIIGNHTLLKAGLVYDTRDNEPNPFSGIWTEMQLHYAPSFLSNTESSYTRFVFTHRQYFTIFPEWMNFVYRLSYQGKLSGEMPFYMLPYLYNTAPKLTTDGVGGSKTVRGIKRNRIVGDGFAYGNVELRAKVLRGTVLNQNVYIALSAFADAGMVTQKYNFEKAGIPGFPADPVNEQPGYEDRPDALFDFDANEVPHFGFGGGFHLAINQNFIITVDYGMAAKKEDGDSGLYINLNFLF